MDSAKEATSDQMIKCDVDTVLADKEVKALPITNEKLAELAVSGISGVPLKEQQQKEQRYYVYLGTLTEDLRSTVYQHSLNLMKDKEQSTQKILSQLCDIIELAMHIKKTGGEQSAQEKLQQMWLEWNKESPEELMSQGSAQPEIKTQTILTRSLFMTRGFLQQLHAAALNFVFRVHGLHASIQDDIQQVADCAAELQTTFSAASSFEDLPNDLLMESQELFRVVQQSLVKLLDHLESSITLNWIVGPLSPSP
ncbi:perilipin-3-like [Ornithorhynchus anatinus]|uniref:perilipin-3-like n=1 Tax=Ornithorhynchus anatinus TaxID=9258 RepID=UPI0010A7A9FF|nr:perilipin-3-like [Ornithorhynchus anatinus]